MNDFWSKVDRRGHDECWPWLGTLKKPNSYGHWRWYDAEGKRHSTTASRKAWELANGPIPAGMYVLHRCDHPPCCNPGHLWLGTHQDNMDDMATKGRANRGRPALTHCLRGHEYIGDNVMVRSDGKRLCRACHRIRSLEGYHRRRIPK